MNFKAFLIISIYVFISIKLNAQEYTIGLLENPIIKNNISEIRYKPAKELIQLPFFDDFSDSNILPKHSLWSDNKVFINTQFAENPPSIGFATFDAIDNTGSFYSNAYYQEITPADTLSSQGIDLSTDNNNVYLSFYYSPQGLGDAPEANDSLILQFYAPEDDSWNIVWFAQQPFENEFKYVILPVNDDKYLKAGFRFRFVNYISLGSNTYPSLAGNCDFWHLDYVYLNNNRTIYDNVAHDIAFTKPLASLLKNYTSMPWSHYKDMASKPINNQIEITYKNNDNTARVIDSLNFTLKDLSNNTIQKLDGGSSNIPANNLSNISVSHNFTFPENDDTIAEFELKAKIVTSTFDFEQNNNVYYTQIFNNYYSYDDGTAEASYGLYGSGTKFSSGAYKFYPEKADNLIGVYIYFTKTFNDASQKYFWLNVWKQNEDGFPEFTPDRSIEGARPEYEGELNKFHYYKLEQSINLTDTFFVGWTQTSDDMLNIGFDYNNIANDKLYYNIGGQWTQSEIKGALMIRPVFGKATESKDVGKRIAVTPNPVSNVMKLSILNSNAEQANIYVYDMQGRLVLQKNQDLSKSIETSNLQNGVYFVRILTNNNVAFEGKFVVMK